MDHGKIQKLLRMLMLLSGPVRYTLTEVAERFEMSERTVFRYFGTFGAAGFVMDLRDGAYCLKSDISAVRSLQKLLHFSEEEACILYKTISLLEGESPVKDRLARKLSTLYDFQALSEIQGKDIHEKVHILGEAISKRRQVCLKHYRSSNSEQIADRIVEPFEFLEDYSAVWAFDTRSRSCKQFRLSRMDEAELLPISWIYADRHAIPFIDAFRMAADQPVAHVTARLSLKAYNLIIEEYPLSENYIQPDGDHYLLDIPVADYHGIGRFVMGLAEDVEVIGPQGFKEFLYYKTQQSRTLFQE